MTFLSKKQWNLNILPLNIYYITLLELHALITRLIYLQERTVPGTNIIIMRMNSLNFERPVTLVSHDTQRKAI